MMKGTIVKMMKEKNFGFIKALGDEKEFFFHKSGVDVRSDYQFEDMEIGFIVEFVPAKTDKGLRAESVTSFLGE